MRKTIFTLVAFMAVLFVSCGGGGCNDPIETSQVKSIEVSPKNVTLHLGPNGLNESQFLKAKVYPAGAEHNFLWSNPGTSIAWKEFGGDSILIGASPDTRDADIVLEETVSGLKDTCHVTVTDEIVPVEKISFDNVTLDLYEGQTGLLVSTTSPSYTSDTLHWTTENPDIATVGEEFRIMNEYFNVVHEVAVFTTKSGSTNIVASSKDGSVVAKYNLTVKGITAINLDKSELELYEGQTESLTVTTVLPEGTTTKNIKWTAENENIAAVRGESDYAYVTGGKSGETNIVATSNDGKVVAKCHVTVKNNNTIDYHPFGDDEQW